MNSTCVYMCTVPVYSTCSISMSIRSTAGMAPVVERWSMADEATVLLWVELTPVVELWSPADVGIVLLGWRVSPWQMLLSVGVRQMGRLYS